MSDNITEQEIRRRLIIFLRIPNEVWTDVLKMLPRRLLVQNISPACFRLKEISNKNVKTIHVIKNADQFIDKLQADDPDAKKRLDQLAANDCQLAGQFRGLFRLTELWFSNEKCREVLRHSLDLLQGCQLFFDTFEHSEDEEEMATNELSENGEKMVFLDKCLTYLEPTKPSMITIDHEEGENPDGTFWLNPTVQECGRIMFNMWTDLSKASLVRIYVAIFHWLHHRPIDCDGNVAINQQVRCMIVWNVGHINWLLDRCAQIIQRGKRPTDRRQFVLSFYCGWPWSDSVRFRRIENQATGEVLLLDRVMEECVDGSEWPSNWYRLRRCLAEEEANAKEFYAEIIDHINESDEFINIGDGQEASVAIG